MVLRFKNQTRWYYVDMNLCLTDCCNRHQLLKEDLLRSRLHRLGGNYGPVKVCSHIICTRRYACVVLNPISGIRLS